MTMKARIHTDSTGNIIVHMEGGLDYDNTSSLRRELEELLKDNPSSQVTLNMGKLDFVGSSGIGHFVETVQVLNNKRDQIRLSGVSSEFMKVFKLYKFEALEAIIHEFDDDETDTLNARFGNRRKTFQN